MKALKWTRWLSLSRENLTKKLLSACLVCILALPCMTRAAVPAVEKNALIDLYNATHGSNWTDNENWLRRISWFPYPYTDPCEGHWYGVVCNNANTHIVQLNLYNNNLNGSIPASLSNLSKLVSLNLLSNRLSGSIPASLSNLSNLKYLALNYNQLNGEIPVSLRNLSKLEYLFLDFNQLTGIVPASLSNLRNVKRLILSANHLSGTIPTSFGNLTNLQWLSLDNNQLTGTIPKKLVNLASLQYLFLNHNQLCGAIPPTLARLTSLQDGTGLSLDHNNLDTTVSLALDTFIMQKSSDYGDWKMSQGTAASCRNSDFSWLLFLPAMTRQ